MFTPPFIGTRLSGEPISGGYTLAYQRCCRNQTIVNIVNPLATGATYSVTISEAALQQCNSSPQFNQWPPIYICAGIPIEFDQSARDIDGDSIVYRLCEPLQGANQANPMPQPPNPPPYLPVTWVSPPYGVANMLNGTPGDPPLAIDAQTGLLTGLPNTVGQFVVGICVEEYRNGQLIGTMRRDFQYNVGVCGRATSAFFAPEIQCGNLGVFFQNQSNNATEYLWRFNDPAQPDAFSTNINPTFTFSDTGTYQITLIANPGTVCADTTERSIRLLPNSLFPGFDVQFGPCSDTITLNVTDQSFDTLSTIIRRSWRLMPGGQSSTALNPQFVIRNDGVYTLELTVEAENGCVQTTAQSFPVILVNASPPGPVAICRGDTATLRIGSGAGQNLTYTWSPVQDIVSGAGTSELRVAPTASTIYIYTVVVANNFGCSRTFQIPVSVSESLPAIIATAEPDTIAPGATSQLDATFNPDYRYEWTPDPSLSRTDVHNPMATPVQTTTYRVKVTDEQGCSATALVTVVVRAPECREPFIYVPNGFSPNGDGRNDLLFVRGTGIDELYFVVYDRWGEKVFETTSQDIGWDGRFRGKTLNSDVFGYYLRVRCFNGEDFFKKGNVTLLR